MERQLAELKAANRRREAQLRARRQRLVSAERSRERKLRTRRLILMGTYVESVAERDPAAKERLVKGLDRFLTRARDRELFGLELREGD